MQADTVSQRRIGRYVLLDRLGRGAMGIVYRAQDPLINRTVAVKVLDILQTLSPEQAATVHERFIREAQTAGNLDHPNIVKIYDVGREDETGEFYIVMEYLPGASLERRLESGPFAPEATVELVRGIASALDAAHARGIIHRDIKPANILFTEEGLAKITDFGIARITTSHLTQDVRDLGTPVFMSPEQVSGRPLDGRADLFSLGVVTYQMLAGQPPFDGKNAVSLGYQIVHSTAPPLREAVPSLPAGIDEVITKILAKEPTSRYPTGRAFVDALSAALLRPPSARAPRSTQRSATSATRTTAQPRPRVARAITWGAAALLGIGAILLARSWAGGTKPLPGPPVRASEVRSAVTAPAPPSAVGPSNPSRVAADQARQKTPRGVPSGPKAVEVRAPRSEPKSHASAVPPPAVAVEPAVVAPALATEATPAPPPTPEAVTAEPAHLAVALGHWVSRGTLTLYADGAPILVRDFSKKKILPYQTTSWEPVDVRAGVRELSAKVTTPKGESYVAGSYQVELVAGQHASVRLGFRNEVLTFKQPGTGKDTEPATETPNPGAARAD